MGEALFIAPVSKEEYSDGTKGKEKAESKNKLFDRKWISSFQVRVARLISKVV